MSDRLISGAFVLALALIQGLAIVQSVTYLEAYVSYSDIPGILYIVALLTGLAIGWTVQEMRLLAIVPLVVVIGGALIFFVVAYSPVWLGDSPHDPAIVNELIRQSMLVSILSIIPTYLGALGGMFLAEQQR